MIDQIIHVVLLTKRQKHLNLASTSSVRQEHFSSFPYRTLFNISFMYFGTTILALQSIYIDIDAKHSGFA